MKALYDLPAPAKLNWFLHVTGRRPDGYHLLQSVFMLIDWHDTLHVERRMDGEVTRQDLGSALPPDDLSEVPRPPFWRPPSFERELPSREWDASATCTSLAEERGA